MKTQNEKILKGIEWNNYLNENNMINKSQLELYKCTHNYTPIYKIGEYFFSFGMKKGYKNLSSLKKLI